MSEGRSNAFAGTCSDCGQRVEAREGVLEVERDPETHKVTYIVRHRFECPATGSEPAATWGVYVDGGVAIAKGRRPTPDAVPLDGAARRIAEAEEG